MNHIFLIYQQKPRRNQDEFNLLTKIGFNPKHSTIFNNISFDDIEKEIKKPLPKLQHTKGYIYESEDYPYPDFLERNDLGLLELSGDFIAQIILKDEGTLTTNTLEYRKLNLKALTENYFKIFDPRLEFSFIEFISNSYENRSLSSKFYTGGTFKPVLLRPLRRYFIIKDANLGHVLYFDSSSYRVHLKIDDSEFGKVFPWYKRWFG